MDIYSFINSKDIRDYLKQIHYRFNSLETAWLIYACQKLSFEKKKEQWRKVVTTMPDCEVPVRNNCAGWRSLHFFLRQYMDIMDREFAEFYQEKPQGEYVYMYSYLYEGNGLPFSPRYHALITNVGDNRDCCCLQALVRTQDGNWEVGSVKHNQLIYNTYPFVSLLYTATYIKGNLLSGEELMLEVQNYINGDEQRGAKLWDYVSHKARTELEIKDFLYSIG